MQQLAAPGPIVWEAHESARWSVPAKGVLDLDDPNTAAIAQDDVPIALTVHVLTHPSGGTFVIDTGIDRDLAEGGRGLVRAFAGSIEPTQSLGAILGDRVPAAVLLTHAHLDHVLGLPDLPADVPVVTGPGELSHQHP